MKNIHYKVNTIELQKSMVESGLTKIKDLANASGIDRNTLSKVIRGIIFPSSNVMYALVSVLNLSEEKAGVIFFCKDLAKK